LSNLLVRFYAFGYQGHEIISAKKDGLFSGDNYVAAIGVFGLSHRRLDEPCRVFLEILVGTTSVNIHVTKTSASDECCDGSPLHPSKLNRKVNDYHPTQTKVPLENC
jgi:hypothetical protein